jgi:DNA-binding CsgD family transcriptional regulator
LRELESLVEGPRVGLTRRFADALSAGDGAELAAVSEVADRLTLSVRTVEGHIYRAMTKTGTTTRQELADLLLQRPAEA